MAANGSVREWNYPTGSNRFTSSSCRNLYRMLLAFGRLLMRMLSVRQFHVTSCAVQRDRQWAHRGSFSRCKKHFVFVGNLYFHIHIHSAHQCIDVCIFYLFVARRHRFSSFQKVYVRRLAANMWALSCLTVIRWWKHVPTRTSCVGTNIHLLICDDLRGEWKQHCRNDAHQTDLIFFFGRRFPKKKYKEKERMEACEKMSAVDKVDTYTHEWDDMKTKIIAFFCKNYTWNNNNKCAMYAMWYMWRYDVWCDGEIICNAGTYSQIRYFICVTWCFSGCLTP